MLFTIFVQTAIYYRPIAHLCELHKL